MPQLAMLVNGGLIEGTLLMVATSQQLTLSSMGQLTIMGENITVAIQVVGTMEGILAEVTLVGGITSTLGDEMCSRRQMGWAQQAGCLSHHGPMRRTSKQALFSM